MKKLIKIFIPKALLEQIRKFRNDRVNNRVRIRYSGLTTQQIFTDIYQTGAWGKSEIPERPFFSGSGSHNLSIVREYVEGVHTFLKSFSVKPNVVDLGCGDFSVGSQIRPLCDHYIACDIVAPLIEFNKKQYQVLDVDFRVLNLISDKLPSGDIVFIRQVLQHLSNIEIEEVIPKLAQNFKYLVLTEHLPKTKTFKPNCEIPTGAGIRLDFNSGVVLTSAPFNLVVKDEKTMLEVIEESGLIKTTIYKLQD